MDQETTKQLQNLLKIPVGELTTSQKAFIRARRSYLTSEQKVDYAEIMPKDERLERKEPKKEDNKKVEQNKYPINKKQNLENGGADPDYKG